MQILITLSKYIIPFVICYIVAYGILHKVKVYEAFIEGVKEGFDLVIDLAPTLIGLLVAVGIFRAAGCLDIISHFIAPVTTHFGIHPEIIPVSLIRIFSSSAATGMMLDIFDTYGPDSTIGLTISIMMSSTETVFYTLSVYFLSIGITKTRWTLPGALLCSFTGVIVSIILGLLLT